MKTPLQELVDWVNDYPTQVTTIHKAAVIAKATEFLEKEKEVMCEFAEKTRYISDDIKEYHDKIFNTKEK